MTSKPMMKPTDKARQEGYEAGKVATLAGCIQAMKMMASMPDMKLVPGDVCLCAVADGWSRMIPKQP